MSLQYSHFPKHIFNHQSDFMIDMCVYVESYINDIHPLKRLFLTALLVLDKTPEINQSGILFTIPVYIYMREKWKEKVEKIKRKIAKNL